MILEVVRLDSKGRITIPATIRLLMNLVEGDKLIIDADPEKLTIRISILHTDALKHVYLCETTIELENLIELLRNSDVLAMNCRKISSERETYRCKLWLHTDVAPEGLETLCREI